MLSVKQEKLNGVSKLSISGEATIENAKTLREELLPHISEQDLELDVSGITNADLSFLQIMAAMYKSRKGKNHIILSGGNIPEPLTKTVNDAGFVFDENFAIHADMKSVLDEGLSKIFNGEGNGV